jgi:DNA-binding transcriptional LysR family regulator
MKIDERHLVQLAAVIETGGVTEGAAMLGMTQPAVSRTLSMLERRIGEPLFIPGRRPLQPTPLGRQLGIHGKLILGASRKASETVQGFKSGSAGRVRVAGVPFFMDAVISGMIASFQMREPDIMIDQSYGNMPDLLSELDANQIDVAVTPIGTQDLGPDKLFEPILPGRNVITCAVGHALLRERRVTTRHLLAYPWVAPLPGSPLMLDLHALLHSLGISELAIRYSGGSLLSVINYIASTNALAILPHSVVFSVRKENKISIVPLEIPQPERTLGIITRRKAYANPAARKFADHVKSEFMDLKRLIERHQRSIVWGQGPFLSEREKTPGER